MNHVEANAHAIIMAFPDFYTCPDGGWHIWVCEKLGIIKQGLVPGGHAAMAIIHKDTGEIEYADLGRYTAPKGLARLRTKNTDPDVKITIKGEFDADGNLTNQEEIIRYFDSNRDIVQSIGAMYVSFNSTINYEQVMKYIRMMERKGSVVYNAFGRDHTNCARFVRSALLEGNVDSKTQRRLRFTPEPTPCPLGSVIYGASSGEVHRIWNGDMRPEKRNIVQLMYKYFFTNAPNEHNIKFTSANGAFDEPEGGLPEYHGAQWLGGLTKGAWFVVEKPDGLNEEKEFRIRKITAKKKQIFDYVFRVTDESFDLNQPFEVTYDCTALFCTLMQNGKKYIFEYERPFKEVAVVE